MTSPLFRQQAIDEQRSRLYGEVIINQPPSFTVLMLIILGIVIASSIFITNGSYARKERVKGYLVPDKGLVKIYARRGGVLTELLVEEGQMVEKNELLFSISTRQATTTETDLDAQALEKLVTSKIKSIEKIKQGRDLYHNRLKIVDDQIRGIDAEITQLNNSITLQNKELRLLSNKLLKFKTLLLKGSVAELTVNDIEQEILLSDTRLQSLLFQAVQLSNHKNEFLQQKRTLPLQWKSDRSDLEKSSDDIEQQILTVKGRRAYSIRAPISGWLTALQVYQGQMLSKQVPLVIIIPKAAKLQAELFLPTRAMGFVTKGQNVLLRYDAFPYQHYGLYKGLVNQLSKTILNPNELTIPLALTEPVYRLSVTLDEQNIKAYNQSFSLQSGMLLEADIIVEQRSLAQWLFAPICALTGKLF